MAWLAVDKIGEEWIYDEDFKPYREVDCWDSKGFYVQLPKGTIKKLTNKKLTWKDEPVEI